ncbi:MAG: hypothetical protein WA510_14160 [Acidobacteriaceae bacterium]
MKHVSETEMIEYYYEESAAMAECERHLKQCAECAKSYAELVRDLKQVKTPLTPERGETYGEQVWHAIRGSLPVYEKEKSNRAWLQFWRPLSWAAACSVLIAVGFLAGRHWERKQAPAVAVAAAADPQARERVVVVVLGDHLDRSERLLVQLNHASSHNDWEAAPLQSEARELLATNRLIRQSAGNAGNLQVEASLDRLERLLVELANQPDGINETNLKRLREEMNTDGLLFDIRVLRSHLPAQAIAPQSISTSTKGAAI